jgi:predicted RNA binding protein YcfA (HicA-like mRNA interferase family)
MGERYPTCNANDVIRVLRRNGFVKVGQKGSHPEVAAYRRSSGNCRRSRKQTIPIGTLKSIIEGTKLSVDEFR